MSNPYTHLWLNGREKRFQWNISRTGTGFRSRHPTWFQQPMIVLQPDLAKCRKTGIYKTRARVFCTCLSNLWNVCTRVHVNCQFSCQNYKKHVYKSFYRFGQCVFLLNLNFGGNPSWITAKNDNFIQRSWLCENCLPLMKMTPVRTANKALISWQIYRLFSQFRWEINSQNSF